MSCVGPNKSLFHSWVIGNYGKNSRTKTVTNEKYNTICRYLKGQECKVNAKFRYWVRSKGFRLLAPALSMGGTGAKAEQNLGEPVLHVVTSLKQPDLNFKNTDCPLAFEEAKNGKVFKRVATIENFYDIIQAAHVNSSGAHAGQKKTYRVVSSSYAFLPREVVTFYLLNCEICKPRIEKYGPVAPKSRASRLYSLETTSTSEEEDWEDIKDISYTQQEEDASSETSSSSSDQSVGTKVAQMKSPLNSESLSSNNSLPNGHAGNPVAVNSNGSTVSNAHGNEKTSSVSEPLIREPPNLNELLNQANSIASPAVVRDDDDDNEDEDDDDGDGDLKSGKPPTDVNPERLKAFNMFVRLFVDENLDRLVPISKQPKEKISAIILSCQRQFPEFGERARKRIRTYLKSCRRSSRLKEPLKRTADNMTTVTAHIPSTQLAEVNACQNETQEATKRARVENQRGIVTPAAPVAPQKTASATAVHSFTHHKHLHAANHHSAHGKFDAIGSGLPLSSKSTPVKLSMSEVTAVRQLISGYRESAAFLYRSADELEGLLRQSESYHGSSQQKHSTQ